MVIETLDIYEGMHVKSFAFGDGLVVISSNGVNGVGKTTLIRLILFALGEDVSMTQGFNPEMLRTRLAVATDAGTHLMLEREGDTITISGRDEPQRFAVSLEAREIKKCLYSIDNGELADNLLGAQYIDQDRGWTLLNRGKVIGDIRFNIESFLRGLSGNDYDGQLKRLQELDSDIKKYKFFVEAAGYQDQMVVTPDMKELSPDKSRDRERLLQLRIQSASLKKRIATIRRAQKDNERFVDYIMSMGLRVKTEGGDVLKITPDNLLYFEDNNRYLNGEVIELLTEKKGVDERIEDLEARLQEDEGTLFNAPRTDTRELDRQIAGMKLDLPSYQAILSSLKEERTALRQQMRQPFKTGNQLFDSITNTIDGYCADLGIEEYFRNDSQGFLTNTLKRKSGTNYHLLVFAFRLAYADAVRRNCGVKLPLIIDSIRGREMSEGNFEKCIGLLEERFSDYQIIIASISAKGIPADTLIALTSKVMEDAVIDPDLVQDQQTE